MSRTPRAGCILVNTNNEILTVRNVASGMWGFPKGRRENSERPIETALRELEEETGRKIDACLLTTSFVSRRDWLYFAKGDFAHDCIVDGIEIDQYEWLTLETLKKRKTSKFTQRFIIQLENSTVFKK